MEHRPISPTTDDWFRAVCDGSGMGGLVGAFDWSATELGPPATWPMGLRAAVGMCLSSRFPMLVTWGPRLLKIYNDGYRAMLGDKHPAALGAPAQQVWGEIWDAIGPMFDEVLSSGQPTWATHEMLEIDRHGFLEECYFTWSYSPLFDDDGSIGGVLDVVTETTVEVLHRRRMACLAELAAALVDAEAVTDVCVRATAALSGRTADLRSVELYLLVGGELVLVSSNRRTDGALFDPALLLVAVDEGRPVVVGSSEGSGLPASWHLVPFGTARREVQGVFVAALNPKRPFDDDYARFVELTATTIGNVLDATSRRSMELGEYRKIGDTLQAAMLQPASDLPTVAARYLPAVGNLAVGGDWYDVIDLGAHSRAVVVGDCVGHGLEAATVMAQLRSAARAMLLEGRDPASVLDGLDLFASSLPGAFCATVACTVIDRAEALVTYARAGHPPPLVIAKDGARWLDDAVGAPLAVDGGSPRRNATWHLPNDAVLILFSDGLIERRDESIDVGLDRLLRAATARYGASVQELADGLLHDLRADEATDDVVLVVKHLPLAEAAG